MIARVSWVGLAVFACTLAPLPLAWAGGTRADAVVRVVAPANASGALGRDDLPPPQLEVIGHPVRVELPAIPAFDPRAPGGHTRGPRDVAPRLSIELEAARRASPLDPPAAGRRDGSPD